MEYERIILGIDPGTTIMGYGLLGINGKKATMLSMGYIDLTKLNDHYSKLKHIYDRVEAIVKNYKPTEMAIESPFMGENAQSALKLGRAQGTAMIVALNYKIPIYEYAPTKIKMAITGNGSAGKQQISKLLQHIFKIETMPSKFDASDGLAAAYCHFLQPAIDTGKPGQKKKKSGSWKDFISQNPNRIRK